MQTHMGGADNRGYFVNASTLAMTPSTITPSSSHLSMQSNPFSANSHSSTFIFSSVQQTTPPRIIQHQQTPIHHLPPHLQAHHQTMPSLYQPRSEMSPSSKSYYDFNQTPPPQQPPMHHMHANGPNSFCFNSNIISSATASLLDMNGSMASV